ncbi:MAG TPA: site-specific integrase, partial [Pirellulaceae bacterium]|nr:site-specific integrase [Pirellulaceae bacterium]
MARRRQLPGYLLHKATGQASVLIDRKMVWLGKHGTDESHLRYDEEISDLLAKRSALTARRLTISELLAAFWGHAKK